MRARNRRVARRVAKSLVAVWLFWGIGAALISCDQGCLREETRKKPALREVLQKAELPPLADNSTRQKGPSVSVASLPDLEELSLKPPELPKKPVDLPDFVAIRDIQERKHRFFEFMQNLLQAENMRIRRERYLLLKHYRAFRREEALSEKDKEWLSSLCKKYRESFGNGPDSELFRNLLLKVDVVPVELGVAQAANESAWGTSRFARAGNNLFGQWCFQEGCGLVPLRRSPGSTHEVETYPSPLLSVRDYMRNLNSHPAYREFRILRYRQRRENSELQGEELAEGLLAYSGIGYEYVHRLRGIMEQYAAYREKVEAEEGSQRG